MALVLENGIWKLQADGSASTVIYSIDFANEGNHNFLTTATRTMGGVTWTAINGYKSAYFSIDAGLLKIQPLIQSAWVTNAWTAPIIQASWSDLMAGAKTGAYAPAKSYTWRAILSTSVDPAAGGLLIGMRTGNASKLDITLEASGNRWRLNRGAVSYLDAFRSDTGVPGPMRTLAVVYAQGSFRGLSSISATHEGEAFGGVPVFSGYGNIANNGHGLNYLQGGTFPLDLSLTGGGAVAYCGAWWYSGATGPGTVLISRLELHEVG